MNDHLWLLSTTRCSVEGDTLTLQDGDASLRFDGNAERLLRAVSRLDGESTEADVRDDDVAAQLLPLLDDEAWLVRLGRPLSHVVAGRPWASRQLAYFAQLTRHRPERALDELAAATVLLVGVGGVGSHAAQALAGAGVGRIVLADPDVIEASNLNRQVFYTLADVGRRKVDAAAEFLRARHPGTTVETLAVNPFTARDAPPKADLALFAGDIDTLGGGARRLATMPMLSAGYAGPVGVVGPLVDPRATACWACTIAAHSPEGIDAIRAAERPLPTGWNCSGSAINGILGGMLAEVAVRFLAPSLGAPLLFNEVMTLDMRTLEVDREALPETPCAHRAAPLARAV